MKDHFRQQLASSEGKPGRLRVIVAGGGFGGVLAFLLWAFVHGLFPVDFRRKFSTFLEWVWMHFFYERGVRLITGEGR